MMRWRPCRRSAPVPREEARGREAPRTPPLPDNPYRRFYTRTPTFEELVRRSGRDGQTEQK